MYFTDRTWLPPSPFFGARASSPRSLSFADLQRVAARDRAHRRAGRWSPGRWSSQRARGMGAVSWSVSPGDTCYDGSHSPGSTHYRFWFPGMSATETSCLAGNATITPDLAQLAPGVPVGYDWSTGQVDPSNVTGATENNPPASAFGVTLPPTPNSSAAAALCAAGESQYCTGPSDTISLALIAAAAFVVIGAGMLLGGRR